MAKKQTDTGYFITLEGGEGAGKSTQIKMLLAQLEKLGHTVVATREPGGTPGAEAIRHVILSGAAEEMGPKYEAELFAAARLDHVENLIIPALEQGKIVLCDRFYDSTRVYQGFTGKVDMEYLHQLEVLVCENAWPNLTLILDLDPSIGMKRAAQRRQKESVPDRFEKEDIELQNKRREGFLTIAKAEPKRCIVIDASGSVDETHKIIWDVVTTRLESRT